MLAGSEPGVDPGRDPARCLWPSRSSPAGMDDVSAISSLQALAPLPFCPGNRVEGREAQPPGSAGAL